MQKRCSAQVMTNLHALSIAQIVHVNLVIINENDDDDDDDDNDNNRGHSKTASCSNKSQCDKAVAGGCSVVTSHTVLANYTDYDRQICKYDFI